jgi:hypothetical protein
MPGPIFVFKCNGTDDGLSVHPYNLGFFNFFRLNQVNSCDPKPDHLTS